MKRQRSENVTATTGKKTAKRETERVKKEEEEEKRESRGVGSGQNDMGWSWTYWEEYCYSWPWLVDEQMSWGSIWLPIWDMDLMGEAFAALYSDVVWDDDIWNLRNQIPYPSEER